MNYAIKRNGHWVELLPNEPITIDDVATSYESMLLWSPQYKTSKEIKAIEEDTIPNGKTAVSSSLIDQDNKPVRVWELAEATPDAYFVRSGDLWERLSDSEAEQVQAAIATQPIRIQNIFRARTEYHSNHELFPLLTTIAETLFGEERALEILAPST